MRRYKMNWVQREHQIANRVNSFSDSGAFAFRALAFALALCMMLLLSGNAFAGANHSAASIKQVEPMFDGVVAVLYSDGTVRVAGDSRLSDIVGNWSNVARIQYSRWSPYCDRLFIYGLTEDGTVLTSEGNIPDWSHMKDVLFFKQGVVGVTEDGNVLTMGTWKDTSILTNLTDVQELAYWGGFGGWPCLKKDGSVYFLLDGGPFKWEEEDASPVQVGNCWVHKWSNVKEIYFTGHSLYAIKNDGTVEGTLKDTYAGLRDIVKAVDVHDSVIGISADGRLLTDTGGNIFTNTGAWVIAEPGTPYYGGEVDISQFNQVRDIAYNKRGLFLLNQDGTVEAIDINDWDLREWNNIKKICAVLYWGQDDLTRCATVLYGIRQDGTVITNYATEWTGIQKVTDQYYGWKLQDMYVGWSGVIGLTTDGELVGDGAYKNVDFSIFN